MKLAVCSILAATALLAAGDGVVHYENIAAKAGLTHVFPNGGAKTTTRDPESSPVRGLPEDLYALVQLQIGNLLSVRTFEIETVAETLAMSRRSLQRSLAQQGLTYSQVLAETRMRRAVDWLDNTDKPVAEIAFDLGYTDGSNFTRAFRRQTGVSPQTFRDKARS